MVPSVVFLDCATCVNSENSWPNSSLIFLPGLRKLNMGAWTFRARELTLARTCSICTHHRRDSMDKQLLRGEHLNAVARRFLVSEDALGRHKKHMQLVIAKAAALVEQKDLAYGSALIAEIARIRADAERLQIESERRQDVRGALRAIHERLAIVELEAKLSGQIERAKERHDQRANDQSGRSSRVRPRHSGVVRPQWDRGGMLPARAIEAESGVPQRKGAMQLKPTSQAQQIEQRQPFALVADGSRTIRRVCKKGVADHPSHPANGLELALRLAL